MSVRLVFMERAVLTESFLCTVFTAGLTKQFSSVSVAFSQLPAFSNFNNSLSAASCKVT